MKGDSHHSVRGVKGLLHPVAVVDVDVKVEHSWVEPAAVGAMLLLPEGVSEGLGMGGVAAVDGWMGDTIGAWQLRWGGASSPVPPTQQRPIARGISLLEQL